MKRLLFVANVLVVAASLTACYVSPDSYAGTVTWGAPLTHAPAQYPRLIVEDDTSAMWPVHQAVNSWKVPVTFGTCVTGINCVRFTEVSTLGGGRVGLTYRPVVKGPEVINIQLALDPAMDPMQRLQDAAHEFGHALGLGHDDIGVMHPAVTGGYPAPNSAELARVRSLYLS